MNVKYRSNSLHKVGIEIIDKFSIRLKCKKCNQEFSPNLMPGGGLYKNWWKYPNKCNEENQ
jgi:hypothetical protein